MVKMKMKYKAVTKYNDKALPESAGLCPWPAQASESCCPKGGSGTKWGNMPGPGARAREMQHTKTTARGNLN